MLVNKINTVFLKINTSYCTKFEKKSEQKNREKMLLPH